MTGLLVHSNEVDTTLILRYANYSCESALENKHWNYEKTIAFPE